MTNIVDKHDRVVGERERREVPGDFVNVRYVAAFVRNESGQLWVPTRRPDKTRWPGGLDFAMGGAVDAGEDYLQAAVRETKEELGEDIKAGDLREIAYLSPYKFPISCFLKVYELNLEREPAVTGDEYAGAKWYSVGGLIAELLANRAAHKSDLLPVVRLCYGAMEAGPRRLAP